MRKGILGYKVLLVETWWSYVSQLLNYYSELRKNDCVKTFRNILWTLPLFYSFPQDKENVLISEDII